MFGKAKNEFPQKEETEMKLGKNISALRKKNGMTQEELANRLGVSPQAVSKWENESSCPDISLLPDIAELFGVTVDDLMRKNETDIVGEQSFAQETPVTPVPDESINENRKICITITQPNGKVTRFSVPLKLVKTGLKIGNSFGLEKEVSQKIGSIIDTESFGEVLTVDGENGETIVINIE